MVVGPTFELRVDTDQARPMITVRGDVDIVSAPKLEAALDRVETGEVVVDLRSADFMDSTGLRVLLNARARLVETGGTVVLLVKRGPVKRLLDLTAVDAAFPTYSSPADIP